MAKLFANSGDPDQMQHSAVSDLGLHCLPITLSVLGVSRLQWVSEASTHEDHCHNIFFLQTGVQNLRNIAPEIIPNRLIWIYIAKVSVWV